MRIFQSKKERKCSWTLEVEGLGLKRKNSKNLNNNKILAFNQHLLHKVKIFNQHHHLQMIFLVLINQKNKKNNKLITLISEVLVILMVLAKVNNLKNRKRRIILQVFLILGISIILVNNNKNRLKNNKKRKVMMKNLIYWIFDLIVLQILTIIFKLKRVLFNIYILNSMIKKYLFVNFHHQTIMQLKMNFTIFILESHLSLRLILPFLKFNLNATFQQDPSLKYFLLYTSNYHYNEKEFLHNLLVKFFL